MINKNLLLLSLLTVLAATPAAGTFPLQAKAEENQLNNLTIIDSNQKDFAYIKSDVTFHLLPLNTYQNRSIIAFDIKNPTSIQKINRLTLRVKYKEYKWWDIFKLNSINREENDIISSDETVTLRHNFANSYVSQFWGYKQVNRIGKVTDVYEDTDIGTYLSGTADQRLKFKNKEFYVVMNWDHTYEEVYISIDAELVGGGHISDGTNDGDYYKDENDVKYFDFDFSSPYAYFPVKTSIKYIEISNFSNAPLLAGGINIYFGTYSFEKNKLIDETNQYFFSANGKTTYNFSVEEFTLAFIDSHLSAAANVRIGYEASSPIISYNFRDENGNLPPPVNDPEELAFWDRIWQQFLTANKTLVNFFKVILFILLGLALIKLLSIIINFFSSAKKLTNAIKNNKK